LHCVPTNSTGALGQKFSLKVLSLRVCERDLEQAFRGVVLERVDLSVRFGLRSAMILTMVSSWLVASLLVGSSSGGDLNSLGLVGKQIDTSAIRDLKTVAEATKFEKTSSYEEVMSFLRELEATGAPIRLEFSGSSTKGVPIPLVIASRPLVSTPEEATRLQRPIVYIQANIHAGEVEGKEAALALLRDASLPANPLLDKVVLIVQPIYNIDGNDAFGPQERNRPGQNGPAVVGLRPNGQGYDLNRDCVKVESPEMASALSEIYNRWNPHVVFDLHTTNGTRHGYPLTYGGPLHANTLPLIRDYSLGEFFPSIRNAARSKFKLELFDYGNAEKRDGKTVWSTFAGDARYVTNYGGLRNAITILSEAMVYEPFENRVRDTRNFVDVCLEKIVRDAKRILKNKEAADAEVISWGRNPKVAPPFAVSYKVKSRGVEEILMEQLPTGERGRGPIRSIGKVRMEVFDRFVADETDLFPMAFLVPKKFSEALAKVRLHGVTVDEIVESPKVVFAEGLKVENCQVLPKFQGHEMIRVKGQWEKTPITNPADYVLVRTAQPLGIVAFELLQPNTPDSLTAWNFFGPKFAPGDIHPVLRVFELDRIRTRRFQPK